MSSEPLTNSQFTLAPSMGKYYAQAVLIPSVLVVVGDILLGLIDAEQNKNYKSEWLNEAFALQMMAVMSLLHTGLVSVLSLTMFFNEKEKIRESDTLRPLAWFLVPMSWLGYLLSTASLDGFQHTFNNGHLWLFLNTLPYVVGSVLSYINFRKALRRAMPLVIG